MAHTSRRFAVLFLAAVLLIGLAMVAAPAPADAQAGAFITSEDIVNQTIRTADIGKDGVGKSEVARDAVGKSEVRADSIGRSELRPGVLDALDSHCAPGQTEAELQVWSKSDEDPVLSVRRRATADPSDAEPELVTVLVCIPTPPAPAETP